MQQCKLSETNNHQNHQQSDSLVPNIPNALAFQILHDLDFENFIEQCSLYNYEIQDIPVLLEALLSNDRIKNHFGIIGLCQLFSKYEDIELEINTITNLLPKLIQFLQNTNEPVLQLQSALALAHFTSGNLDETDLFRETGAIPIFISLVKSGNDELIDAAVLILVNLSAESKSYRDMIRQHSGIKALADVLINPPSSEIYKNSTKAIANLVRDNIHTDLKDIYHLIPILIEDLRQEVDPEIISDITSALSGILVYDESLISVFINLDLVPILLKLLQNSLSIVISPISKIIADLFNGDDEDAAKILSYNPIPLIYELLFIGDTLIRREACLILSNLSSKSPKITEHLISNTKLVQKLMNLCTDDCLLVRRVANAILANCAKNSTVPQKEILLKNGVLELFIKSIHPNLEIISITGLTGILEFIKSSTELLEYHDYNLFVLYFLEFNGKQKAEWVSNHHNHQVKKLAREVLSILSSLPFTKYPHPINSIDNNMIFE